MEKKAKFYDFKNLTDVSADLYVYGEIVGSSWDKWTEEDVDLTDFKDQLDQVPAGATLNLYVNSPGGSVFAASTMASMLKRAEERGIKVEAYVDGLAASAASFLIMAANDINIYKNSMIMIHKPMSLSYGNADDFQKQIDVLNNIEESTMIPLYMDKFKEDEESLKNYIAKESWLGATKIQDLFEVNFLDEEKEEAAYVSEMLFRNYKNVPQNLVNKEIKEEVKEVIEESQIIDYSNYEERLKNLKERK